MSHTENLADVTVKITTILNKHLAEKDCTHTVKQVVKEIFQD